MLLIEICCLKPRALYRITLNLLVTGYYFKQYLQRSADYECMNPFLFTLEDDECVFCCQFCNLRREIVRYHTVSALSGNEISLASVRGPVKHALSSYRIQKKTWMGTPSLASRRAAGTELLQGGNPRRNTGYISWRGWVWWMKFLLCIVRKQCHVQNQPN